MTKKKDIPLEDLNTWQNYIKNPTDVFDKDKLNKDKKSYSERFKYDLHGFTLAEANKKVKEIIFYCVKKNFREILFITGKGIHSKTEKNVYASQDLSKLKYSVPDFIISNYEIMKYVISISKANKIDGGDGAIVVKLKKKL